MLQWVKQKLQITRNLIGVDIGTSGVKLLELHWLKNTYQIEGYGFALLPKGCVKEKEIKDRAAVLAALHEAKAMLGSQNTQVALALPDAVVISKIIQMDAILNEREIAEELTEATDQYLPQATEELNLDFQCLGTNKKEGELIDVLLVATRRHLIDARVALLAEAGLQVQVVDVESHASARVGFRQLTATVTGAADAQPVAIVDIGAAVLTLSVIQDQQIVFTHNETLRHDGTNLITNATAALVFKEAALQQIQRSLQFFSSLSQAATLSCVLVAGGNALLPGFIEQMRAQLEIPVLAMNPFLQMTCNPRINFLALEATAPQWLLSSGLALRNPYVLQP